MEHGAQAVLEGDLAHRCVENVVIEGLIGLAAWRRCGAEETGGAQKLRSGQL